MTASEWRDRLKGIHRAAQAGDDEPIDLTAQQIADMEAELLSLRSMLKPIHPRFEVDLPVVETIAKVESIAKPEVSEIAGD